MSSTFLRPLAHSYSPGSRERSQPMALEAGTKYGLYRHGAKEVSGIRCQVPGFYWHIDAAMLRSGEFTSPWRGKPAATIWLTARWAIGFAFPCHSPLVTALCGFGIFSSLFTLHSSLLFPLFLTSAACILGNRRKAADRRLRFRSAATRRRFPSPQLDAAIQPPLTSQRQKKREQAPALRNFEPQVRGENSLIWTATQRICRCD